METLGGDNQTQNLICHLTVPQASQTLSIPTPREAPRGWQGAAQFGGQDLRQGGRTAARWVGVAASTPVFRGEEGGREWGTLSAKVPQQGSSPGMSRGGAGGPGRGRAGHQDLR